MLYKGGYINGKKHIRTYYGNALWADYTPVATTLRSKFNYPIGVTLKSGFETKPTAYLNPVKTDYDVIGAENAFKQHIIQSKIGTFNFSGANKVFEFARANNKGVFVHTVIWADVVGDELRAKVGSWTTQQFWDYYINHITVFCNYLIPNLDLIVGVDVVNEAHGPNGLKTDTFWYEVLGPTFVDVAFSIFKSIIPNVPGYLNEFDLENSTAKGPSVNATIANLASKGIVVDGIGSQMHSRASLNMVDFERRLRVMASSGKLIRISELDCKLQTGTSTSPGWSDSATYKVDANGQPLFDSAGKHVYKTDDQIELELFRSVPARLKAHSDFFTNVHKIYPKAVPPAQRGGISRWNLGNKDSGINYPIYQDFPGLYFNNYEPTPAYYDLLAMTVPEYQAP